MIGSTLYGIRVALCAITYADKTNRNAPFGMGG
jgi:hypothetical protein